MFPAHTEWLLFRISPCRIICKYKGHARQSPVSCFSGEEIVNHLGGVLPQNISTHHALAAISARELVALVHDLDLAVPPGEPDGAGAGVVLAGVEARGAVVTRPVVGAEVEVLAAHLAAPALLTLAGPGTGAGAVNTPGVDLALGALRPLPALVTSEMKTQKLEDDENKLKSRIRQHSF